MIKTCTDDRTCRNEALIKQLVDALRAVEWVSTPVRYIKSGELTCPWCGRFEEDSHADDCGRENALAAVESPDDR